MKKLFFIFLVFFFSNANAQSLAINPDGSTANTISSFGNTAVWKYQTKSQSTKNGTQTLPVVSPGDSSSGLKPKQTKI
jgi:hypothetical protein